MNQFLDKSITVSVGQVWRWTKRGLYLAVPVYVILILLKGWELQVGGVSLQASPFADRVPTTCRAYADRIGSNSTHVVQSSSIWIDALLLRGRVSEGYADSLIKGTSLAPQCFGYAILNGLHGRTAREANFTERWVDKEGRPVVSVQVEYHQTLKEIGYRTNKEE